MLWRRSTLWHRYGCFLRVWDLCSGSAPLWLSLIHIFAVFEGNEPVVIANSEGKRTTPSVVAFVDGGERKIGDPAKRQAITNPTRTVFSIKRFMGENWDQVQKEIGRMPYKVVKGDNNTPRVDIDGRLYTCLLYTS